METMIMDRPVMVAKVAPDGQVVDKNSDVNVIILLCKNFNFSASHNPYELVLCGKKMWEWVKLAAQDCEVKTIPCTEESDILALIRPYLDEKPWTVVLYSDTPLFSAATFNEALSYARARQTNVLKLRRGYVFNTNYIRSATMLLSSAVMDFGSAMDFFTVDSTKKLQEANEIIRQNIIDYHTKRGIIFSQPKSVHIDADVIIEPGVCIEQNNAIYGMTYIGKGTKLMPNNVIVDSVISGNCVIKSSHIEQSRISENTVVGPFESVINKSN